MWDFCLLTKKTLTGFVQKPANSLYVKSGINEGQSRESFSSTVKRCLITAGLGNSSEILGSLPIKKKKSSWNMVRNGYKRHAVFCHLSQRTRTNCSD